MGELLEADDAVIFKTVHDLVTRQELLARNRLQQDKHWKYIKLGYAWSGLYKVQDQDMYRQEFPAGTDDLRPRAVPNKAADLCNKLVEILNTDPPAPSPTAQTDDEAAERASEIAAQFLRQDGGEEGTDDDAVFWCQVDLATTSSTAFLHTYVDPYGGGWVPSQIKAHPLATDPAEPLIGPDGNPTTDYVLQYVTEDGGDDGAPQQFTNDPLKAGRTWLPKIKVEKWAREHWRLYPEDKDLNQCQSAIGLLYCTLGEARRRWPDTVGSLSEEQLGQLCDWTPNRYIVLLPPALRSRWKLTTGNSKIDPKGSSGDERIMFYYAFYRIADPDYVEGAAVCVSGADIGVGGQGYCLSKDTLSAQVEVPDDTQSGEMMGEVRLLELPLTAIRLIQDAEERDPTGKAFMGRIGGASEAQSRLASAYLEAIDIVLHPARFATATSPVQDWQVQASRAMTEISCR